MAEERIANNVNVNPSFPMFHFIFRTPAVTSEGTADRSTFRATVEVQYGRFLRSFYVNINANENTTVIYFKVNLCNCILYSLSCK